MGVSHKGAISLGLLYIPVGLYTTTRDNDVKFNQLCKDTKERVKYKKYCPSCNKEVKQDEIIKGYEYENDKYVIMTEEELEKIKTKKDKTIHILQFVKLSEIDQIYYEKNYYAIPEAGAEKAFELLRSAMLNEQKVALAKTVIGTKENLIVLYPTSEGMIAKTLFYHDEIVPVPKQIPPVQLSDAEITMAKTLIDTMTGTFDATAYKDEYQERLRDAIMQKIHGEDIVAVDTSAPNNVIDLMEALQRTLAMSNNQKLSGTA
ncbi:Ku protein [Lachnospiraceae bacterium MD1]|uniref:Non-homologous end joining protein Ku n=1 Tax=Variimorphobacter saccharofermentans TaxID=2755051 RepID=A0A839JZM1_9FIRM|nr:Ku protein [Variimorphobacter saccharofermentans]MBB2182109.1 Ku protein [Variimorphobacter saccharofermentans]